MRNLGHTPRHDTSSKQPWLSPGTVRYDQPTAYLVTDQRGMILEASREAAAVLASLQHLLIGRALLRFVAADDRLDFCLELAHVQETDREEVWEVNLQPLESVVQPVAMTVTPIHNRYGEVVCLNWLLGYVPAPLAAMTS